MFTFNLDFDEHLALLGGFSSFFRELSGKFKGMVLFNELSAFEIILVSYNYNGAVTSKSSSSLSSS